MVESVSERSSELADPAIANVDHVVLLFGLTQPPFDPQQVRAAPRRAAGGGRSCRASPAPAHPAHPAPAPPTPPTRRPCRPLSPDPRQVTRFLVSIEAEELPITLVLNKADLLPPEEVAARLAQCRAWGYGALAVSCETGLGVPEVLRRLEGCTAVVAGPSGAGKSSLINALRYGRHRVDSWADEEHEQGDLAGGWGEGEGEEGEEAQEGGGAAPGAAGRLLEGLPLRLGGAQAAGPREGAQFLAVGARPGAPRAPAWLGTAAAAAAAEAGAPAAAGAALSRDAPAGCLRAAGRRQPTAVSSAHRHAPALQARCPKSGAASTPRARSR